MAQRRMNLEEAAQYLHMEAQEVARLLKQDEIPHDQSGSHPLFSQQELDAWASRRILGMKEKPLDRFHRESCEERNASNDDGYVICSMLSTSLLVADLPSRTKAAVLHDLTAMAEAAELLYDPKDLLHSLEEREGLCSTGLVDGVAIVHPRHHDPYLAIESFIGLARTRNPIHFGAPDGKPTDLFFLLVCLEDRRHLHALARLCTMIQSTPLLEQLRAAADHTEMCSALRASEGAVLARLR